MTWSERLLLAFGVLFLFAAMCIDVDAHAQSGVMVQDEGTNQGTANLINCSGSGVTCTMSGRRATIAVTGSSGLPADPAACSSGQYVTDQNASGTLTCAQPAFSQLSGTATDGQLANNYSGVGACSANQWASTLNDNAAPTCTQPGFSNLSGTASIAQGGTTETASTEDAVLVGNSTTDWEAKVLPSCSNATTSKLLYNSSTNTFSCGTDTDTDSSGLDTLLWHEYGYVVFQCQPGHSVSATTPWYCPWGNANISMTGTISLLTSNATRRYITTATSTTLNATSGHNGSLGGITRSKWAPRLLTISLSDDTISNRRVWFGLVETGIDAVAVRTEASGTAASVNDFAAVGFDTAVDASWMLCTGDGTNYGCKDTGIDVAADTVYKIDLDWRTSGSVIADINDTRTEKTSNVSTADVALGVQMTVTNLSGGTAREYHWGRLELVQN
jgi:hypothetical protein